MLMTPDLSETGLQCGPITLQETEGSGRDRRPQDSSSPDHKGRGQISPPDDHV